MNLLIAYLLGIFTAVGNKPSQKRENIPTPREQTSDGNDNSGTAFLTSTQLSPPDTVRNNSCQVHYHTKVPMWKIVLEVGTFVAAVGAFISTAIYACITSKQLQSMNKTYGEIQSQTMLMRQQLVGTQAAVVRVDQPNWDNSASKLTAYITNDGAVNAIHVNLNAQVFEENPLSETPIGEPMRIQIADGVLQSKNGLSVSHILPWHQPEVEIGNWPGRIAFIYRGHLSYENGFGDPRSLDFCFLWLPKWSLQGKEQGWGGGGNFQPGCDIKTAIRNFLATKKQATQGTP